MKYKVIVAVQNNLKLHSVTFSSLKDANIYKEVLQAQYPYYRYIRTEKLQKGGN